MKDGWILNFLVNRIAIYLKRLMVFLLYIQSYQVVGISTRYKAVLVSALLAGSRWKRNGVFKCLFVFAVHQLMLFVLCAAKTNDPESGKGLINLESPSLGHPQS
jgi:hypothetical protein